MPLTSNSEVQGVNLNGLVHRFITLHDSLPCIPDWHQNGLLYCTHLYMYMYVTKEKSKNQEKKFIIALMKGWPWLNTSRRKDRNAINIHLFTVFCRLIYRPIQLLLVPWNCLAPYTCVECSLYWFLLPGCSRVMWRMHLFEVSRCSIVSWHEHFVLIVQMEPYLGSLEILS